MIKPNVVYDIYEQVHAKTKLCIYIFTNEPVHDKTKCCS